MTSPQERAFLHGLTRLYFTGQGVIIDAGVFLSASSAAFGEGALENTSLPNSAVAFIHSYSIAVRVDEFERHLRSDPASHTFLSHDLQDGGSLDQPFKEVLKKYESLQRLSLGTSWPWLRSSMANRNRIL